ncbi:MAG: primosomal protein N', partial [Tenericutes bacterium]|nr:primosomal protein N' [Mycoplasmatota bacterium]
MIARVLVDIKSKNVDKTYDYLIPQKYLNIIEIGTRVIVPFGKRQVMGFCLDFSETSSYSNDLKSIDRIIDMESYLTEELIELARQIQLETSSLLIKILETMLPAALKVVYKAKLQLISLDNLNETLKPYFQYSEFVLLESIPVEHFDLIKKEIKKKNVKQIYDIKSRNKSLSLKYVGLSEKPIEKITNKQQTVVDYLKSKKDNIGKLTNIKNNLNITSSVVDALEKKGYVYSFYKEIYRQIDSLYKVDNKSIILNQEQEEAFIKIKAELGNYKTFLLHGVTGSGKTEIYIKAIDEVRKLNQSVIFLVPEISLTPMMMARFKSIYDKDVAVLHSGLSTLEKYDEWRRIAKGEAKIVVGARSACFAPVDDLGLVIVDECHASTYKQDNHPNYYAIDILKRRSKYYKSVIVLGSATPNIDSFARQSRGYYELLTLKNRALNAKMPEVEVADMKKEFIKGNSSSFSEK